MPKRDENGEWRRLHYEELHNMYCSLNIVRVIKSRRLIWVGHVARIERPLRRPRRRWEDNIRMNIKEIVINTRN